MGEATGETDAPRDDERPPRPRPAPPVAPDSPDSPAAAAVPPDPPTDPTHGTTLDPPTDPPTGTPTDPPTGTAGKPSGHHPVESAVETTAPLPVTPTGPTGPTGPADPADPTDSAVGETSGPRHAAPEAERGRHPRRWFLGGAAAVLVAGGAGVAAAVVRSPSRPDRNPAPAALLAAVAAERALLADLDATTGGDEQVRSRLTQVRADHAAHLTALTALVSRYDSPRQQQSGVTSAPATRSFAGGTPRTLAQLQAAEQRAATAAASHAAALSGRLATLLASISACEAGHAELLS